MPFFRAVVVDKNGTKHTRELYAGCAPGARQHILHQFGQTKHKHGAPIGGKIDIVIQSLEEIDPPQ
jgi:hypothetical protein